MAVFWMHQLVSHPYRLLSVVLLLLRHGDLIYSRKSMSVKLTGRSMCLQAVFDGTSTRSTVAVRLQQGLAVGNLGEAKKEYNILRYFFYEGRESQGGHFTAGVRLQRVPGKWSEGDYWQFLNSEAQQVMSLEELSSRHRRNVCGALLVAKEPPACSIPVPHSSVTTVRYSC